MFRVIRCCAQRDLFFCPGEKNLLIICTLGFKIANTYFHVTMAAKGKKIILDYLGLCYSRIFDCQLSNTSLTITLTLSIPSSSLALIIAFITASLSS